MTFKHVEITSLYSIKFSKVSKSPNEVHGRSDKEGITSIQATGSAEREESTGVSKLKRQHPHDEEAEIAAAEVAVKCRLLERL